MDLLCLLQIVCMQEGISHKQAEQAAQAVQAVQAGRPSGRLKGSRQQRPNCVRNAMACYDDDDCRKEMHFRIEPRRRRRNALLVGCGDGGDGGSTYRGKANRAQHCKNTLFSRKGLG